MSRNKPKKELARDLSLRIFKQSGFVSESLGMFTILALFSTSLTLFRPGYFCSCGTEGGGGNPPPPSNSENIKAMTTQLKGQIVCPKMFPLRSATSADDVMWRHNNVLFSNGGRLGSAILDFLIFPKPSKTAKIDQEVIKINKLTRKWSKNLKFTSKK